MKPLFFFVGSFLMITLLESSALAASGACGNVEVSKGDVKIQSGQTKASVAASVGSKICSGDTIIAGKDSRAKLKMEDGNELNISPDSKIVLETYQYNPAENKKKVLLNILSGKVRAATKQENMYNDKSRDGADNSFQVRTKSAVAGVRGTDFMTGYDPKTNKSEVVTFKGQVEFGQRGAGGQIVGSVQVGAGMKTEMLPGQPPAPPKMIPIKELQQMNSDSRGDVASGGAPGAGPKAGDGDAKSNEGRDDKKADGKQNGNRRDEKRPDDKKADGRSGSGASGQPPLAEGSGENGGTPKSIERSPANAPPPSMVGSIESNGGTMPTIMPSTPRLPNLVGLPELPKLPTVPVCQQCIDAIQNSPTRLKINVTVQ